MRRVTGISEPLAARFMEMRRAMLAPPAPGTASEGGLSIHAILMPYVQRAATVWLLCAALGAALYRAVRRVSWLRAVGRDVDLGAGRDPWSRKPSGCAHR